MIAGCAKTKPSHRFHDRFPFSSVKFHCKHGGSYRQHRPGTGPTKRLNQRSVKMNCPVAFRMKLNMVLGKLEVLEIPDLAAHNHPLTEELYNLYPETRRMNSEEKNLAFNLLSSGVRPRVIATAINTKRQEQGRKGLVIAKDVLNLGTERKRKGCLNVKKTEEEILSSLKKEMNERDPDGIFEMVQNGDNQLEMIYIQTSEMKVTFHNFPTAIFVDSAYKINVQNFSLLALIVEDEHGFGKPVCLALLKNERPELLKTFFNKFKAENPAWPALKAAFIKKTFTQQKSIMQAFSTTNIYYHGLNVIKMVKAQIFKESLPNSVKQSLLKYFKDILLSKNEKEMKTSEIAFLQTCSKSLKEYYFSNWRKTQQLWCLAFRRVPGPLNATSQIDTFFNALKTALTGSCSSIAKKFLLSECVEVIVSFLKTENPSQNSILESAMCEIAPDLIFVGQKFSSHADALKAIKSHGEATNQVFFVGPGCAKTSKKSPFSEKFPYSSPRFICKHGGQYRPHTPGSVGPTIRTVQQSCKTDCPVLIKMKLHREGFLEVLSITDISEHNHPLSDALYNFYREVRRLSPEEKKFALEMLEAEVKPRVIANAINSNRKQTERKGVVLPKDISNLTPRRSKKQVVIKSEIELEQEQTLKMEIHSSET